MEQGIHLLLTEDQWIIQNVEDLKIQFCEWVDSQIEEDVEIHSASTDGKLHFKIRDVVLTRPDEPNETELLVTIERVGQGDRRTLVQE